MMQEMEKLQAKGELGEEELRALEMDVTGRIMLASWRGTRFEVIQVLREVSFPYSLSRVLLSDLDNRSWTMS
jgi:hypothetical protein